MLSYFYYMDYIYAKKKTHVMCPHDVEDTTVGSSPGTDPELTELGWTVHYVVCNLGL